jgi:hypothetical protein
MDAAWRGVDGSSTQQPRLFTCRRSIHVARTAALGETQIESFASLKFEERVTNCQMTQKVCSHTQKKKKTETILGKINPCQDF